MSQRRFGLRLRMLATLTGAGLLCTAVLALVLLVGARDEITRRHVASARAGMRAFAESVARHCGGDAACFSGAVAVAGLSWQEGASCGTPQRVGERLVACEEVRGGAVRQELDLAPAADQARSLVGTVLAAVLLGMLLLVVLVSWLLDRQLVAPLGRIDDALDRVTDAASFAPLLAEGGDLLGRLAPAVNRLDLRLREERARVQSQIEELQASNRELRAAREEVARSERLASVGRLAAGVAHEVGNPMTALLGSIPGPIAGVFYRAPGPRGRAHRSDPARLARPGQAARARPAARRPAPGRGARARLAGGPAELDRLRAGAARPH